MSGDCDGSCWPKGCEEHPGETLAMTPPEMLSAPGSSESGSVGAERIVIYRGDRVEVFELKVGIEAPTEEGLALARKELERIGYVSEPSQAGDSTPPDEDEDEADQAIKDARAAYNALGASEAHEKRCVCGEYYTGPEVRCPICYLEADQSMEKPEPDQAVSGEKVLYVVMRTLAVEGAEEEILATTTKREDAEGHLRGLEGLGFYSRIAVFKEAR